MPISCPTPDEIRTFRKAMAGISQAELGARIGASTRAVEEWEAGRREPPAMLRLAMAALAESVRPWDGSRLIVHRFIVWDQQAGETKTVANKSTGERIIRIRGTAIENTAESVNPVAVDDDGRWIPPA